MTTTTIRLRESGADTDVVVIDHVTHGVIGWAKVVAGKYNAYNLLGDLVINAADTAMDAATAVANQYETNIAKLLDTAGQEGTIFFQAFDGTFAGAVFYDAGLGTWKRVSKNGTVTGSYNSFEIAVFAVSVSA